MESAFLRVMVSGVIPDVAPKTVFRSVLAEPDAYPS
jgi:hypothetical protein